EMPAEWHRHSATWLTWPKDPVTWPDRVPQVQQIYIEMMAAITPHETVNLLVDDQATEDAVKQQCQFGSAKNIVFHQIVTVDSWIRDYGPNFLVSNTVSDTLQFVDRFGETLPDSEGRLDKAGDKLKCVGQGLAYNDWIFNAWGHKYEELKQDNSIPARLTG